MSTPGSSRLRFSLSAIGAVGAIYLVLTLVLQVVSHQAEATGRVYPYKNEDWLRYLLPTLWPSGGKPLVLLTGPSTVRENLLIEQFSTAFPQNRIFQGAFSQGTLHDVMTSLSYVEREYGPGALPSILVLGVSPRFLAELPPTRPFAMGLSLYSQHYRVPAAANSGFALERKPVIRGLLDRARFLRVKQHRRYRSALAWLTAKLTPAHRVALLSRLSVRLQPVAHLLGLERAVQLGIHAYNLEVASPYRYRDEAPLTVARISDLLGEPGSWWGDLYRWDPARDAAVIRARVDEFLGWTTRHGIELYVVGMPERTMSLARYRPGFIDQYQALLHSAFWNVPVVDLRCFLGDAEFHDAEHAEPAGAQRLSERVIRFIDEVRAHRVDGRLLAGTPELTARYSDTKCLSSAAAP